jgi:hypothetical protein
MVVRDSPLFGGRKSSRRRTSAEPAHRLTFIGLDEVFRSENPHFQKEAGDGIGREGPL